MQTLTDRWHAAFTSFGLEPLALRNLAGGAPNPDPRWLAGATYRAIWPRYVERRTWRNTTREMVRGLSAGMMLISFDGSDGSVWHDVRNRCGERTRFIGGEYPDPVADSEVARLMERAVTADGELKLPEAEKFSVDVKVGDSVRSLLGATGVVLWLDAKGCRVQTMMFGRLIPAWFPHGDYEKVYAEDKDLRTPQYGRRKRVG
jgi:transcription antitermination factor NusG